MYIRVMLRNVIKSLCLLIIISIYIILYEHEYLLQLWHALTLPVGTCTYIHVCTFRGISNIAMMIEIIMSCGLAATEEEVGENISGSGDVE